MVEVLHDEGEIDEFLKKDYEKVPSGVVSIYEIFGGKFF